MAIVDTATTTTTTTATATATTAAATTAASAPVASGRIGAGGTAFDLRLADCAPVSALSHPRFERLLDATTGSVARTDNAVTPLLDGLESFEERLRLINTARSSIHLQTFVFNSDDTGWQLARHLAERARSGIEVRVIVDGIGSNRSTPKIFDFMRASGVDVRSHDTGLDLLSFNNRWHEKHMIVDGRVAVEGGMNIADEYSLGGSGRQVFRGKKDGVDAWRDVDVRIEGPAVHDVQRAFLRNWSLLGAPVATTASATTQLFPTPTKSLGGPQVRVVQHHPHGDPPDDHTMQLYLNTINAATKSITIENAYFVPPKLVRDALVAAAHRGVSVRVMTNSKQSSDMGFVVDAQRYFYRELLAAGVQIFEKLGGTLHSKTMTVDGRFSIIGSVNLNGRSDGLDTESAIAIRDVDAARALDARFAHGLYEAPRVTSADISNQGLLADIKQWTFSTLAWTF